MNRLSRERHLWIRIFNQTKDMLRPTTDLNQEVLELERIIVQAEILERKWSDEDALWIVPRCWHSAPCIAARGKPVAIMGEYVIFLTYTLHYRQTYTWVFIHDIYGPVAFEYTIPAWGTFVHYMDLRRKTFFVVLPLHEPLL